MLSCRLTLTIFRVLYDRIEEVEDLEVDLWFVGRVVSARSEFTKLARDPSWFAPVCQLIPHRNITSHTMSIIDEEIRSERERQDSLGEMTLLGARQFSRTRRKDIISRWNDGSGDQIILGNCLDLKERRTPCFPVYHLADPFSVGKKGVGVELRHCWRCLPLRH